MKFNITKHGLKRVRHVKMNYYHYVLAVDYILYLAKNVPLPSLEKISLTTLKRFADKLYKWFTQDFDLFDEMDTDAQDFMKAFIIENGLFFYYAIQFNIFISEDIKLNMLMGLVDPVTSNISWDVQLFKPEPKSEDLINEEAVEEEEPVEMDNTMETENEDSMEKQ